MERFPETIVAYDGFAEKFRVCAFHIVIDGQPFYKPVPGLAYDHAPDAARGSAEYRPIPAAAEAKMIENGFNALNKAMS